MSNLIKNENMKSVVETLSNADMTKGTSLWQDAYFRFRKNKAAVASVIILALMVIVSFISPYFAPWDYETIDWDLIGAGRHGGQPNIANGHYFGVDNLGRDIFARTMQGTQISLMVGLLGTAVAVFIGLFYGAIAGFVGGKVDNIMMRLVDILMSIPTMFIIIIAMVVFGRSILLLFMAIGLFALACLLSSGYAVIIESWPFAVIEFLWAGIAFWRWWKTIQETP